MGLTSGNIMEVEARMVADLSSAAKTGKKAGDAFVKGTDRSLNRMGRSGQANFSRMSDAARKYGVITNRAEDSTRSLASAVGIIGKRLIAYTIAARAILAFRQAVSDTINVIKEFEFEMVQVTKVMNVSDVDIRSLSDSVLKSADAYAVSTIEAAKAARVWAQQGKSIGEVSRLTSESLKLSTVSALTTVQATEALTAIMNQFNIKASDTPRILDQMNEVANKFAVTEVDMAEAIKRGGSAAVASGVSFETLIGIITTLQQVTRKGGRVHGTFIKTFLARLFTPATAKAIKDIAKVEIFPFKGEAKTGEEILKELGEAWKGLGRTQRIVLAKALGGQRQFDAASALMNNFSNITKVATVQMNSFGSANRELEKLMGTLTAKFQRLKNSFFKFAVSIGDSGLLDILKGITDSITFLVKAVDSLDMNKLALALTAGMAAFRVGSVAFRRFGGGAIGASAYGSEAYGSVTPKQTGSIFQAVAYERSAMSRQGVRGGIYSGKRSSSGISGIRKVSSYAGGNVVFNGAEHVTASGGIVDALTTRRAGLSRFDSRAGGDLVEMDTKQGKIAFHLSGQEIKAAQAKIAKSAGLGAVGASQKELISSYEGQIKTLNKVAKINDEQVKVLSKDISGIEEKIGFNKKVMSSYKKGEIVYNIAQKKARELGDEKAKLGKKLATANRASTGATKKIAGLQSGARELAINEKSTKIQNELLKTNQELEVMKKKAIAEDKAALSAKKSQTKMNEARAKLEDRAHRENADFNSKQRLIQKRENQEFDRRRSIQKAVPTFSRVGGRIKNATSRVTGFARGAYNIGQRYSPKTAGGQIGLAIAGTAAAEGLSRVSNEFKKTSPVISEVAGGLSTFASIFAVTGNPVIATFFTAISLVTPHIIKLGKRIADLISGPDPVEERKREETLANKALNSRKSKILIEQKLAKVFESEKFREIKLMKKGIDRRDKMSQLETEVTEELFRKIIPADEGIGSARGRIVLEKLQRQIIDSLKGTNKIFSKFNQRLLAEITDGVRRFKAMTELQNSAFQAQSQLVSMYKSAIGDMGAISFKDLSKIGERLDNLIPNKTLRQVTNESLRLSSARSSIIGEASGAPERYSVPQIRFVESFGESGKNINNILQALNISNRDNTDSLQGYLRGIGDVGKQLLSNLYIEKNKVNQIKTKKERQVEFLKLLNIEFDNITRTLNLEKESLQTKLAQIRAKHDELKAQLDFEKAISRVASEELKSIEDRNKRVKEEQKSLSMKFAELKLEQKLVGVRSKYGELAANLLSIDVNHKKNIDSISVSTKKQRDDIVKSTEELRKRIPILEKEKKGIDARKKELAGTAGTDTREIKRLEEQSSQKTLQIDIAKEKIKRSSFDLTAIEQARTQKMSNEELRRQIQIAKIKEDSSRKIRGDLERFSAMSNKERAETARNLRFINAFQRANAEQKRKLLRSAAGKETSILQTARGFGRFVGGTEGLQTGLVEQMAGLPSNAINTLSNRAIGQARDKISGDIQQITQYFEPKVTFNVNGLDISKSIVPTDLLIEVFRNVADNVPEGTGEPFRMVADRMQNTIGSEKK